MTEEFSISLGSPQPSPTVLREKIKSMFPDGYWKKWEDMFSHDFFSAHIARTEEYDKALGEKISGKKVLEVGGFPGLLTAWLLTKDAKVTVVDAPRFSPEWYKDWLNENHVKQVVFDVCSGNLDLPMRYDICIMSDVLLHIEGFPSEFIESMLEQCGELWILTTENYGQETHISPARSYDLHQGFGIPLTGEISEWARKQGSDTLSMGEVGGRYFLQLKGISHEVSDSSASFREQQVSSGTSPDSGDTVEPKRAGRRSRRNKGSDTV